MKIQLLGWESEGLRCPNVNISLDQDGQVPRIALIQMPNGTGKTTTLNLIRAALTGLGERWSPEAVNDLRRINDDRPEGRFVLRMAMDGRPLTIELQVRFDEGRIDYWTTSPGSGGRHHGYAPPVDVRRFLTHKFVHLFIFDAELCTHLLDRKKSEAENAIDALCQLDLFEEVKAVAQAEWEQATKQAKGRSKQALTMQRNKVEALKTRERALLKKLKAAESRLEEANEQITKLEEDVHQHLGASEARRQELDQLKSQVGAAQGEVDASATEVMRLARCPHTLHPLFSKSLQFMRSQFDILKLPESTSRQFFEELLEEPNCICGRPFDKASRKAVEDHAEAVMGDDIIGILNALKQKVGDDVERADSDSSEDLDAAVKSLKGHERARDKAQTAFSTLERVAISESDEDIQAKKLKLEKLKEEAEIYEWTINCVKADPKEEDKADEKTECLAGIQYQLREAKKKLDVIADTVELGAKKELILKIASDARGLARDRIREAMLRDCNARLESVLSRDPIRLKAIQASLELTQSGASMGQTLSVGYTFLSTLLHRGQHAFPLVVDSPAGPLDHEVRRHIAALLPGLCDQFVGFTISSEREGFVTGMEEVIPNGIMHLTLFRKTEGTRRLLKGLPSSGVIQTDNAVLVHGRDYFHGFDMVDEED